MKRRRTIRKRKQTNKTRNMKNKSNKTKIFGGEETPEQIYNKMKDKIEKIHYKTPENIITTFYNFVKKNPQYTPLIYIGVRQYIKGMSMKSMETSGKKDMYSIELSGRDHQAVLDDILNHFILYNTHS